jgi:hypothetical protein
MAKVPGCDRLSSANERPSGLPSFVSPLHLEMRRFNFRQSLPHRTCVSAAFISRANPFSSSRPRHRPIGQQKRHVQGPLGSVVLDSRRLWPDRPRRASVRGWYSLSCTWPTGALPVTIITPGSRSTGSTSAAVPHKWLSVRLHLHQPRCAAQAVLTASLSTAALPAAPQAQGPLPTENSFHGPRLHFTGFAPGLRSRTLTTSGFVAFAWLGSDGTQPSVPELSGGRSSTTVGPAAQLQWLADLL